MLQLMDYSLAQYNPIREEVIKLIRNQEVREGNWDIITLMNGNRTTISNGRNKKQNRMKTHNH